MNAIRTNATPMPSAGRCPCTRREPTACRGRINGMRAGSNGSGDDVILLLCRAQGLRPGFLPVFREQSGCSPSVVAVVGRCNGIMSNPNANPYQPQPQPGPQKNKTSRRFFTWVRSSGTGSRRQTGGSAADAAASLYGLAGAHISTCVGDCMYIVLRFWRSSVRTRLVSDAGCTRWAHLGRGPHCRPMGLELSGMLPVPRRWQS